MLYFFILGINPALSIAEILAVLKKRNVNFVIDGCSKEVLVVKSDVGLENMLDELGGTIKYGEILGEYSAGAEIIKFLPKTDRKIYFGFSIYKLDDDIQNNELKLFEGQLKKLAMTTKNDLRGNDISARFVTGRDRALSSVIVKTNKLLSDRGAEFVFLVSRGKPRTFPQDIKLREKMRDKTLIGKTLDAQEFDEYSFRDYGRPRRNILRGMLPPKVAKIMINLAGASRDAAILDPFCGEGTILGEATILGYKNLFGYDVDKNAVEDSRANLEWTKKMYSVSPEIKILTGDVKNITETLPKKSIDTVITEPLLGPLLRGGETPETIQKIKNDLEDLYEAAFKNFAKILKPEGRVVFIFPVWKTSEGLKFIDLEKVVEKSFKIEGALPPNIKFQEVSSRGGIIWQRPEQKVLREIVVLTLEA